MMFLQEPTGLRLQKHAIKGFTIIELLVTIACIGILAAAATPSVAQYIRNMNLRDAVYQISGDLYTIKSQAIRTRANCNINFDTVTQTYTLSDPNRTVDLKEYRGGVTFTANPDASTDVFSPTIVFNTRGLSGLAPAATTQVYVTNQDNRIFRIQASAAGAISIRRWSGPGGTWER